MTALIPTFLLLSLTDPLLTCTPPPPSAPPPPLVPFHWSFLTGQFYCCPLLLPSLILLPYWTPLLVTPLLPPPPDWSPLLVIISLIPLVPPYGSPITGALLLVFKKALNLYRKRHHRLYVVPKLFSKDNARFPKRFKIIDIPWNAAGLKKWTPLSSSEWQVPLEFVSRSPQYCNSSNEPLNGVNKFRLISMVFTVVLMFVMFDSGNSAHCLLDPLWADRAHVLVCSPHLPSSIRSSWRSRNALRFVYFCTTSSLRSRNYSIQTHPERIYRAAQSNWSTL